MIVLFLVEITEEVDHSTLCSSRRHCDGCVAFIRLDARRGVCFLDQVPGDGNVAIGSGVVQSRAACTTANQCLAVHYAVADYSANCHKIGCHFNIVWL